MVNVEVAVGAFGGAFWRVLLVMKMDMRLGCVVSGRFWLLFVVTSTATTSFGFHEGSKEGGQLVNHGLKGSNLGGADRRGRDRTGGVVLAECISPLDGCTVVSKDRRAK